MFRSLTRYNSHRSASPLRRRSAKSSMRSLTQRSTVKKSRPRSGGSGRVK